MRIFAKLLSDKPYVQLNMPDGGYNPPIIDTSVSSKDEHHIALGKMIDSWGILELYLFGKFKLLLGVSHAAAAAISHKASGTRLIELIENQMPLFSPLTDKEVSDFEKISSKFRKLNTKRNNLVHAIWTLEATIDLRLDIPIANFEIVREKLSASREEREQLNDKKNQKIRMKHIHTLDDIEDITSDIHSLSEEVGKYFKDTKLKSRFTWAGNQKSP